MQTKFWMFSNAGESHEPSREGYRCMIEEFGEEPPHNMKWEHIEAIWCGRVVMNWMNDLVVRCDDPGPLEDMPWASVHIVSDRLRVLLETCAPACAQYLQIVLRQYDNTPTSERYWIANWTHIVECLNDELSHCVVDAGPYSEFDRMVIDASKIPLDMPICRMKRSTNTVVVRDDIRRTIINSGMTGCQFYTIEQM